MTVTKDESGQEDADDKGDMPAGAPQGAPEDGYTPSARRLERERYK
ncbi:amino acid ABC transporter permease, partial [Streptomyces hyaluromycini]